MLAATSSSPGSSRLVIARNCAACPLEVASAADAAFQRRHALLEDVGGGVHDAGIDVAELLQREQRGRMVGVLEHEGSASGRSGTARARLAESGVWPACRDFVAKPSWRAGAFGSGIDYQDTIAALQMGSPISKSRGLECRWVVAADQDIII